MGRLHQENGGVAGPRLGDRQLAGDPLASSLLLAVPFSDQYGLNDISAIIKGTGGAQAPTATGGGLAVSNQNSLAYGWSLFSPSTGNDWARYTLPQTLGTGNFTVEFWVNSRNADVDGYFRRFISQGDDQASQIQIGHVFDTSGKVTYFGLGNATANISSAGSILNAWSHIALVRNSGTVTLYVNGTSQGTVSDSNNKNSTNIIVSTRSADSAGGRLNGFMQDLRIYSAAKYTANFTPPGPIVPRLQFAGVWQLRNGPLSIPTVIAEGGATQEITVGGIAYRLHAFAASGGHNLRILQPGALEYLIVAGGGGGADLFGGGGAGGVLSGSLNATTGLYPVVVGAGGAGATVIQAPGSNGGNSSLFGFTAIGGGAGGADTAGASGGSGGGGGDWAGTGRAGGAGTAGQGNSGGSGDPGAYDGAGGGGGGAGGAGGAGSTQQAGAGGIGVLSSITGVSTYYGGGGGGTCWNGGAVGTNGLGGLGGGGIGGGAINAVQQRGGDGQPNTGGGGGAGVRNANFVVGGGNGGSGIVIVRYVIG